MGKPILLGGPGSIEDSVAVLARALFRGDLADDQVRALPPQQLFYAVKQMGLESALDILGVVSRKQYSGMLDFEFWTRDSFREDRFWNWVYAIDDPHNLEPIQRFLSCVDTTVLALIIRKYVEVIYHEEPDDLPPGPNYYTPDKGFTWLCLKISDPERHRLLGKLLAFLYQSNLDFFYKLINNASQGTSIEFEELGFNEKSGRLKSESIPDLDESQELHTSIKVHVFGPIIERAGKADVVSTQADGVNLTPVLFFNATRLQPLTSCLELVDVERFALFQLELGAILNSAVVFFVKDFGEEGALRLLTEQVIGVINIGLEVVSETYPEVLERAVFSEMTLKDFYRLGLGSMYDLRKISQRIPSDVLATLSHMNPPLHDLLLACAAPLPAVPEFVREDATFDIPEVKEERQMGYKSITSIEALRKLTKLIEDQVVTRQVDIRAYESKGKKHRVSTAGTDRDHLQ